MVNIINTILLLIILFIVLILVYKTYFKSEEKFSVYTISEIGNRENQEDSIGVLKNNKGEVIACVADGMGGFEFGAEASNLAVQSIIEAYHRFNGIDPENFLLEQVKNINKKVYTFARRISRKSNVGSTFVSAMVRDKELYWVSVGDSRIYLFRNGQLTQLNREHVYENILKEKLLRREISQYEFDMDRRKAMLTSFIGDEEVREIDRNIKGLNLTKKDKVILCSDGLFKTLSDEEIRSILMKHNGESQLKTIARSIKKKNKKKQDNMSVVVIEVA